MNTRIVYGDEMKYLHSQVTDVLKIAAGYGGVPFGGYVRDVVTKVIAYDYSSTEVKDLDIWFKTSDKRDSFVYDIQGRLTIMNGLESMNYLLKDESGDALIWIDLVVSNEFPGNDFDVNMLSWDCRTNKIISHSYDSVSNIIKNIRKKRAQITDSYMLQMGEKMCINRMYYRFLNKGWRVFYGCEEVFLCVRGERIKNEEALHRAKVASVECLDSWWQDTGYTKEELQLLYNHKVKISNANNRFKLESLAERMKRKENIAFYCDDVVLIKNALDVGNDMINITSVDSLIRDIDEGKITAEIAFGSQVEKIKKKLEVVNREKRILDTALNKLENNPACNDAVKPILTNMQELTILANKLVNVNCLGLQSLECKKLMLSIIDETSLTEDVKELLKQALN